VEQEGTYPLPEAQVDRFMLKVYVSYPTKEDELEIMKRMSDANFDGHVRQLISREDIFAIRDGVTKVNINEGLERYIVDLIYATRTPAEYGLKEQAEYIQFGASPRASINLHRAAKAVAYFDGRDYVLPEDIKEVAYDVLNHRLLLNYEAEADGITSREIIDAVLNKIKISK
jgi:MoxR-like ATPase